jgi:hypothetical protein
MRNAHHATPQSSINSPMYETHPLPQVVLTSLPSINVRDPPANAGGTDPKANTIHETLEITRRCSRSAIRTGSDSDRGKPQHPLRGLVWIHAVYSWGSASLHPKLYAGTRSAGSS